MMLSNFRIYLYIFVSIVLFSISTYVYIKINEFKQLKINNIALNKRNEDLKNDLDYNLKIIDTLNQDFLTYQKNEELSILKDQNISNLLKTDKHTYKNVFEKIKGFEQ